MKKTILIAVLLLTLALSACGQGEAAAAPSPGPEIETPVPAEAGDSGLGPILDEIRERVYPGTAGCSMTAAQLAVELMNWAADSGVTDEAARQAAVDWLTPLGNDEAAAFAGQMELVDTACRELTGEHGADLLSSIGLTAADCRWGDAVPSAVTAVLSAVGVGA